MSACVIGQAVLRSELPYDVRPRAIDRGTGSLWNAALSYNKQSAAYYYRLAGHPASLGNKGGRKGREGGREGGRKEGREGGRRREGGREGGREGPERSRQSERQHYVISRHRTSSGSF